MAKIRNTMYSWEVNNCYAPPSALDVTNVIDLTHTESNMAPIDTFIQKNIELNMLLIDSNKVKIKLNELYRGRKLKKVTLDSIVNYIDDPSNISPVMANLVLLGHISAVESYFREMFRKVILIDEIAAQTCREKTVSYGAAITHTRSALPDALLESITFSGAYNITESLKEYIGIKGAFPDSLNQGLKEYSKVCHLRHCIVHRFGKLGVNNAIKLDWDTHKLHLDKPIKIDYTALQEVSQICFNIVKEVNNYTWQMVMMRQIANCDNNSYKKLPLVDWKWNWSKDQAKFKKYYSVFFSTLAPPALSGLKAAYDEYNNKYHSLSS